MTHVCTGPCCPSWEKCEYQDIKAKYPESEQKIAQAHAIALFERLCLLDEYLDEDDVAVLIGPILRLIDEAKKLIAMSGQVEVNRAIIISASAFLIDLSEGLCPDDVEMGEFISAAEDAQVKVINAINRHKEDIAADLAIQQLMSIFGGSPIYAD